MHISDVEKHRIEKEDAMRHGYHMQDSQRYPHMQEIHERQRMYADVMENKHAMRERL